MKKTIITFLVLAFVIAVFSYAANTTQRGGEIYGQMTLLDEFAAHALEGLVSKDPKSDIRTATERAYEYAEKMLVVKAEHEKE